ncbi:MAG TPA: hypothetical protein VFO77_02610 [Actinoplanes sp.]|nr:hypothetical protein [Actinoplanes sp.]
MVDGFVYAGRDDPGAGELAHAEVGRRIRNRSLGPPWIVVSHTLDDVTVARWPGRLFRVASVPPGNEQERAALAAAAENLRPDAGYTRVFAVDVVAELAAGSLFGPYGEVVGVVLDFAQQLAEPVAWQLTTGRDPGADAAYGRAWLRWLDGQPNAAPYLNHDHRHTLAIPGASRRGPGAGRIDSPIGHGLTLLCRCVTDTARSLVGEAAFTVDEEGDLLLVEPWRGARTALLHAAMATGMADLIDATDAARLTAAWAPFARS